MAVNANLIVQHVTQFKNGIKKTCQCECKHYCKCKKDYNWNPNTCICGNSEYLEIIADTWVFECDKLYLL